MNKSKVEHVSVPKPIVLVGMMGAGKTSVGQALAKLMDLPFYDSDVEIEKQTGLTIPQIFTTKGEAEFRRIEQATVARLLDAGASILSLGGGAFMNDRTRALIKSKAFSVWLRVDKEILIQRVRHQENRPLLSGDAEKKMQELLPMREPIYATADLIFEGDYGSIEMHAQRLKIAISPAQAPQTR